MTKQEAIKAMHEGKKVTHMYFHREEWVTIKNGQILLEDGVRCSEEEFWKWRSDYWWDKDWKLYNE